ncbi:MAG: hypothetical protein JO076_01115 [Verrucomicrobia bacterium]|nr:hypothetical protein [Verrucomicrobiota bacterium]
MAKNFQPLLDELKNIIEASKSGRLSQADEQKGAGVFKDLVLAGGKALSSALELIGDLPWFVPVNGTVEAWAELTPARQKSFLAALKPLESASGQRIRLSMARGLYRVDSASALKLLVNTLQSIRKEAGLEVKDRQMIASTLIGKNKPWLLQVDPKGLKPVEAQLIALCAIESSTNANPPSAMAIMQWAKPFQPLAQIPEALQAEMAKTFRKWSSRWRSELAKEELPPQLAEAVQTKAAAVREPDNQQSQKPAQEKPSVQEQIAPHPGPKHTTKLEQPVQRSERQDKHVVHPKTWPEISDLLRQVENRFHDLRTELSSVRNQLKQIQPQQKTPEPNSISHSREIAKLREENAQLCETINQLQETLNELANERFDIAISSGADTENPVTDPLQQYKSLLTMRLRDQITKFQALNRESHVDGLPLLVDNLLHTLEENGIDLSNLAPPPPPVKRRY